MDPNDLIRVALFDDSPERRESLKFLVNMSGDMFLVGQWPDLKGAAENVAACKPDVVLMDVQMPGMSGIEGVCIVRGACSTAQVLMQTVFDDPQRVFQAIRNGASGYILKSAAPEKVLEAIREVKDGGSWMSPSIARLVLGHFQPVAAANDHGLTDREREVLELLVEGMSYKMIADRTNTSYHTVNGHLKKIYQKLHVHSLGEAVSKALKQGLVRTKGPDGTF